VLDERSLNRRRHPEKRLTQFAPHRYGEHVDDGHEVDLDSLRADAPRRLSGAAALKLHVTLALGLALCTLAFWFEFGRAERGNSLSWAYVFEWPLLGIFGVYMWWNLLHEGRKGGRTQRVEKPAIAPEYAGMLAAWQEHQRELAASQEQPSAAGDDQRGTSDQRN
jgi:hypothetical protein